MASSLDIIIVNWNAGQLLRDCLDSIVMAAKDGFELSRIVVVDNASSDGSHNGLDDLPLPLIVIRNRENRGFAFACDQGAAGSRADYLLFLNPDTELFPESLVVPIAFMGKADNQRVGICGIRLIDDQGRVSRTCACFPTPAGLFSKMLGLDIFLPRHFPSHFMKDWDHSDTRAVDHVMGAFFLVRRRLFESLGGFDDRFFVYLEDVDFSLRARQAGHLSFYLADASAYHLGGASSQQARPRRLFYSLRSKILYGYKHFGSLRATGLFLATLFLEPLARFALSAARLSPSQMVETAQGYVFLWRAAPEILRAGLQRGRK